jgi:hypothetical protein
MSPMRNEERGSWTRIVRVWLKCYRTLSAIGIIWRLGKSMGGRARVRKERTHLSNVIIPFLHSDSHFDRFLHKACGYHYGIRLPRHGGSYFLNGHCDRFDVKLWFPVYA